MEKDHKFSISVKPTSEATLAEARGSAAVELQPLVKELRTLANAWQTAPSDPHNIANAVMVALLEVSNAIVRAYGEPPTVTPERKGDSQ